MQRALIDDYRLIHSTTTYGNGTSHLPWLLTQVLALRPCSLIDYGAGVSEQSSRLARKAKIQRAARFDPAVPAISSKPEGVFDLLISTDVLEHIPDEEIDGVLSEMAAMGRHQLHIIDTRPATTLLSDGRNAHVSLHDADWWVARMRRFMPDIRAVPYRKDRVALRTWGHDLPYWRRLIIERNESLSRSIRKRLAKAQRSPTHSR